MTIFFISYAVLFLSALLYMWRESSLLSEVQEHHKSAYAVLRNQNSELLKKVMALEEWKKTRDEVDKKQKCDVDNVQEHCSLLRQQQQIHDMRTSILEKKLVPVEVNIKSNPFIQPDVMPTTLPKGTRVDMKAFSGKAKKLATKAKSKGLM